MALHPRQNSTFAFDVVFTFYVCCPLFDITVSQCDIELATLEFHDATLQLSPPKFYLRFPCHFHILFVVHYATLQIHNVTSNLQHLSFTMRQLSFYARFNMLGSTCLVVYACFIF